MPTRVLAVLLGSLLVACPAPRPAGEGEGEGNEGEGEGEDVGAEGEGEGEAVGEGEGEGEGLGEGEGEAVGGEGEGEGEAVGGEGEGEGEGQGPGGFGPYDVDGADVVTTHELDVTTDDGNSFTLLTFVPSSPGPHPVVSLSPGLLQPAVAYTSFGQRLASHGVVVVIRNDPGFFTQTPEVTADIVYVVATWLTEQDADATSPLFENLDVARVGLAGHSRGGKASLIAAEAGLQGLVQGWFGLDPVDAAASASDTLAVTDLANVGIPTVFLGAEVSSNCSPAASNHAVLFAAAPAPSVHIVGLGAGHTQMEDQDGCVGCAACSPAGTADDDVVLDYAVRYLTAFFARELLGDDDVGAGFAGAGIGADVAAGRVTVTTR